MNVIIYDILFHIHVVDKCDRCHVDANCIGKGVCVCREGYKGDGIHHCEKTSKLYFDQIVISIFDRKITGMI